MTSKRQQIIEKAHELFGKNGFYATGVDQIMGEAGISKRTLYKYFPGKSELIKAVIEHYRDNVKQIWGLILDSPRTPKEKIVAIFEAVQSILHSSDFHGCLIVNAMGEYLDKDEGIETRCQDFKYWEQEILQTLTKEAGLSEPEEIAMRLFLILEGMFSFKQVQKKAPPDSVISWVKEIIEGN